MILYQQEWLQFFKDLNEAKEVAFKRNLILLLVNLG